MICTQPRFPRVCIALAALSLSMFGAVALTGCGSSASEKQSKAVGRKADELLNGYAARSKATGISAAIVRGDSLLWSNGTGVANKNLNVRATDDSVFLVASVSKTVTAVAAMQLAESGKLDLDRNINDYLDFKIANPKNPDAVITIRHLLTHTSGIADDHYALVATPALYYKDTDPTISLQEICRAFFTTEGSYFDSSSFSSEVPGTAFNYSNIGFMLAGYVIERAAGQKFDEYCKENIFSRLDMTKTSWRVADFTPRDMAMPYDGDGQPLGNYTFADYPNGALRTTVKDLSRFLRAFVQRGTLEGKTLLKPSSVEEMRRISFPEIVGAAGQGLGWGGLMLNGISLVGHAGAEQGVSTGMFFDPATGVGAIYFQNRLADSEEEQTAIFDLFAKLIETGQGK